MESERPTILGLFETLRRDDPPLAETLGRAEIAARIVAREVGIARREGVPAPALRDFAERAFAEILAAAPSVSSVRAGDGTLLGRGLGRTHDVFVEAVRETDGEAPRTEVRVLRRGAAAAVAAIVHGDRALLAVAAAGSVRLFEEDREGGPFAAVRAATQAAVAAALLPMAAGSTIQAA